MKLYKLTHNGKEIHKGTENSCYLTLQRVQSNSAAYAIKNEGFKINELIFNDEEAEKILKGDKYSYIECELLENKRGFYNERLKVKVLETGEIKMGNTYAMTYDKLIIGENVMVMQNYLTDLP